MKKENRILVMLYVVFGALLVCANCVAAKQVSIGTWFGIPVSITVGIICYPFTFLITDIIGELYGKKYAQWAVYCGLAGQVIAIILVVIANLIQGDNTDMQTAFNTVLGSNWILTLGSLTACFVSQVWDVWVFHKIRDKYIEKHGTVKGGKWIWNNASTITSQLFDSVIFYLFLILMLHTQGIDLPFVNCVVTVLVYWLIKIAIALLDTPIFYLCTRRTNNEQYTK